MLPVDYIKKVQSDALDLAIKKNNDYSGMLDNIGITGKIGLVVRLFDKASRLLSLVVGVCTGMVKQEVKDESVRDTAVDMINYATYLVCVLDGKWHDYDVKTKKRRVMKMFFKRGLCLNIHPYLRKKYKVTKYVLFIQHCGNNMIKVLGLTKQGFLYMLIHKKYIIPIMGE